MEALRLGARVHRPRRVAARQHRRLRAIALHGREGDQADDDRRHQPVRHLASGIAERDHRARLVRRDLRRLATLARSRVGSTTSRRSSTGRWTACRTVFARSTRGGARRIRCVASCGRVSTRRSVFGGFDSWPTDEIQTQIATIRDARAGSADPPGHVHFRLSALLADNERIAHSLAREYAQRALVPAFTWLGSAAPPAPSLATAPSVADSDDDLRRRRRAALVAHSGSRLRRRVDDEAPAWRGDAARRRLGGQREPDEIAVSAISATGVESEPAVVAWPPTANGPTAPARRGRRR